MAAVRSFAVFGEPVEVLVDGRMTGGLSATITQVSAAGGGVPLHSHQNEDETFFVVEGEYEFCCGDQRTRLSAGDSFHAARGSVHQFTNVGASEGKLVIFIAPAGLETYLEAISTLLMPQDAERLVAISSQYGIAFPGMEPGTA